MSRLSTLASHGLASLLSLTWKLEGIYVFIENQYLICMEDKLENFEGLSWNVNAKNRQISFKSILTNCHDEKDSNVSTRTPPIGVNNESQVDVAKMCVEASEPERCMEETAEASSKAICFYDKSKVRCGADQRPPKTAKNRFVAASEQRNCRIADIGVDDEQIARSIDSTAYREQSRRSPSTTER
ncbi:hypothetical protein Scep_002026 [Stephania cephalantha]|uniref:Uncharacterized protein n=1 Tax=Stephania cephalantha TaxID=152367 RepID=A0AAP0LA88_9MAGN